MARPPSESSNVGAVFEVSAWSPGNRPHYGLSFGRVNRRIYVNPEWPAVWVSLDGKVHEFELDDQFWTTCPEIRGSPITTWLARRGYLEWPEGHPPHLKVRCLGDRKFEIIPPSPKLYDPFAY